MVKIIKGKLDVADTITDDKFVADYVNLRKPVVLTGMTKQWPALKKWTVDYFNEKYGNLTVPVCKLQGGLSHPPNYEIKTKLSTYLTLMQQQDAHASTRSIQDMSDNKEHIVQYLQQCPVSYFKDIQKDYTMPTLLDKAPYTTFGLNTIFIGLHYDRPLVDNLYCQISGIKRFRMWRPAQGRYFSPFGFDTMYCHVSKIPELDANEAQVLKDFPDFAKASEPDLDIHLEGGDMMYIPRGWWHHVTHIS
eukprot:CAMPEP_0168531590 /NCGR_PEP_ID=MMETSP0405-20121227/15593_1 /TAXON_ID=498012 /ORGANISM="Trichosphaerium sp, Strain Am-I-7 wt" /LENGTH=247 /DNA_ID=CAMNT_0008556531 /DNA_START=55 /DNA_END=794 /DNA_ORIENTATION=+